MSNIGNEDISRADLIVASLALTSASVAAGGSDSVSYQIENIGSGSAGVSVSQVYLSTDSTITTSDILLATVPDNALGGGQSDLDGATFTLPANLAPGTYYIGVIADAANQVAESNETNNTAAIRITVTPALPDLVVQSLAVGGGTKVAAGSSTTVSYTVENQGSGDAGASVSQVYLSTDSTITTSDTLLGTISDAAIGAGTGHPDSATIVLPYNLAPGTYYIGVIADAGNQVNESNETNNTASIAITVQAPNPITPVLWIDDANGNLGTVDPVAGTVKVIGDSGEALTDIAFTPQGQLYGISFSALYQINQATGAATLVGNLNAGSAAMNGLAAGPDGTLYATSNATEQLYTINPNTGQATALSGNLAAPSAGDIAFSGGVLYCADTNGNLEEVFISNNTVTAFVVGAIGFNNVYGLASGPDGTLYGVSGTDIITINTATGAGTLDLNYSGQGLQGGFGLTAAAASASFPFGSGSDLTEALYIGYFGRAGDPTGDNYWLSQLAGGASSNAVAAAFAAQAEAQALYPFLASPATSTPAQIAAFIGTVYQDLFNRAADSGGLAYWQNQLETQQGNPQAVAAFILNVINGAQGSDQATIINKVTVADYFTQALGSAGIGFGTAAAALAHSAVAEAGSDPSTVLTAESLISNWLTSQTALAETSLVGTVQASVHAGSV